MRCRIGGGGTVPPLGRTADLSTLADRPGAFFNRRESARVDQGPASWLLEGSEHLRRSGSVHRCGKCCG